MVAVKLFTFFASECLPCQRYIYFSQIIKSAFLRKWQFFLNFDKNFGMGEVKILKLHFLHEKSISWPEKSAN